MRGSGKLITFEGIEGCGKTTQVDLACRMLEKRGLPHLRTREPGGTRIGSEIRKILLDPQNRNLAAAAELLLYAADRAQHVQEQIVPALEKGAVVLCDRYTDATLAYQGFGRGLDRPMIETLNRMATGGLRPALTLFIDVPVTVGLARAIQRNDQDGLADTEGRFEEEAVSFHTRVREGYLALTASEPARVKRVDGNRSPEETHQQILSLIEPLLVN
jgi:dTMP kinase